jgi:hypothetical protein
MTDSGQSGAGSKPATRTRLVLEILTLVALVGSVGVNIGMWRTYGDELAEMRVTNTKMQQAQNDTEKAREEDSAQHARERAEDQRRADAADKRADDADKRATDENARANEAVKQLLEAKTKAETVRIELANIRSGFTQAFDDAVTTAYKSPWDKLTKDQLKDLAQTVVAQRKTIRDKTQVVQTNMTVVYEAVDSLIDELEHELTLSPPNPDKVKSLLKMIYDEKDKIVGRVEDAMTASLNTLGCNAPVLGAELLTIQSPPQHQP